MSVPEVNLAPTRQRVVSEHYETPDGTTAVAVTAYGGSRSVYYFKVDHTRTGGKDAPWTPGGGDKGTLWKDTSVPRTREWRYAPFGATAPRPGGWPTLGSALYALAKEVAHEAQ